MAQLQSDLSLRKSKTTEVQSEEADYSILESESNTSYFAPPNQMI